MKNKENDEEIDFNSLKNNIIKNREEDLEILRQNKKKLYLILEHANLELTKDKKNPELINSDDHISLIKKM